MTVSNQIRRLLAALLVTLIPVAAAQADVIVVDGAGGGDFLEIQPAIDAALDGDVILIRPGDYPAFGSVELQIDSKGLSLVADGPLGSVALDVGIIVRGLGSDQRVLLDSLSVKSEGWTVPAILDMSDCQGAVRIEDCTFTGKYGSFLGIDAASIRDCQDVVIARSDLVGRLGYFGGGRAGISVQDSSLVVLDCSAEGSINLDVGHVAAGLRAERSTVYAAGCTFTGGTGMGGDHAGLGSLCGNSGGDGAPAIMFDGIGHTLRLRDCVSIPGDGGQAGISTWPTSCPTTYDGDPGVELDLVAGHAIVLPAEQIRFEMESPVREGTVASATMTSATVNGPAGAFVGVIWSLGEGPAAVGNQGPFLMDPILPVYVILVGPLPPAGNATVPLAFGPLIQGFEAFPIIMQSVGRIGQQTVLGAARTVTILDDQF
jgi:hypothetical protein